jgi:LemA protein
MIYNRLVDIKHTVSQAWSNIDILLKQRHDELPKLVDTCKQYMGFEQDTLKQIIAARSQVAIARDAGDIGALGTAENMLRVGLGNLFAVVEDYPELKASEKFQHLQTRITHLENGIADRREYYNEAVKINNVRSSNFPKSLLPNHLNLRHVTYSNLMPMNSKISILANCSTKALLGDR